MILEDDWRDIDYLATGTDVQRRAHQTLTQLGILTELAPYDATLVSTVCNDIDIPGSDLDIICYTVEPLRFIQHVSQRYGSMRGFTVTHHPEPRSAVVIQFFTDDFEIEIFAQNIPVSEQNALRHMLQTNRVLKIGGSLWRGAIRSLKLRGVKTEPAVAQLLDLPGDPYQAVLALETLSEEALTTRIRERKSQLPSDSE